MKTMTEVTRRRLMAALAGSGLVLGVTSSKAFAFSEESPSPRLQFAHDNACGATSSHKQLVDEVEKTLGDKVSDDEKKAVIAQLTCPVCGCPLAGLF